MENEDFIFTQKEEDQAASEIRRHDYALQRDQEAVEYNQIIAKRLVQKEKNIIKCTVCGKEFPAGVVSQEKICPDCTKEESQQ